MSLSHVPVSQVPGPRVPVPGCQGPKSHGPNYQGPIIQSPRVSGHRSQVLGSWVSDPDFGLCPLKACVGFSTFDSFSFLLRPIHPKENHNFRENFKLHLYYSKLIEESEYLIHCDQKWTQHLLYSFF